MSNNPLADSLMSQLQGQPLQQMTDQLGLAPAQAGEAVQAALPMLLGALSQNAQSADGASALLGALQRDHGGADWGGLLGGVLGGALGGGQGGKQLDAGGILGHIFGGNASQAQAQLEQNSGLSGRQAGQLLKMLAPIVMGFLAKQVSARQLDAGSLGNLLGGGQGGLGGMLASALDQNGDGRLDAGDLIQLGSSLLGGRR